MAVHAVRVRNESPEVIARVFKFNRACIYRWLKQYDAEGFEALKSRSCKFSSTFQTLCQNLYSKLIKTRQIMQTHSLDLSPLSLPLQQELIDFYDFLLEKQAKK